MIPIPMSGHPSMYHLTMSPPFPDVAVASAVLVALLPVVLALASVIRQDGRVNALRHVSRRVADVASSQVAAYLGSLRAVLRAVVTIDRPMLRSPRRFFF